MENLAVLCHALKRPRPLLQTQLARLHLKEKELSSRERELDDSEEQLEETERKIKEKEEQLKAKERQLDERERELEERERRLEGRERQLKDLSLLAANAELTISTYVKEQVFKAADVCVVR